MTAGRAALTWEHGHPARSESTLFPAMFGQKNIVEEALALYAGAHVVERVKNQRHDALKRFSEEVYPF